MSQSKRPASDCQRRVPGKDKEIGRFEIGKTINKTTQKDFEVFKAEAKKWIEILGLKSWRINFEHNYEYPDDRATCIYNVVNRSATLILSSNWSEDKVSLERVKKVAFHEVCEVMLCNLRNLAEYRYTTKIEIDEEVHGIIRTLENTLFEKGG